MNLFSAVFMQNTFKGPLHSVAATRAQVHPPEKKPPEGREMEMEIQAYSTFA